MKVEYIKCDICGEVISPTEKRYRHEDMFVTFDPLSGPVKIDQKLDICLYCYNEFKEWVAKKKKGAKEDE